MFSCLMEDDRCLCLEQYVKLFLLIFFYFLSIFLIIVQGEVLHIFIIFAAYGWVYLKDSIQFYHELWDLVLEETEFGYKNAHFDSLNKQGMRFSKDIVIYKQAGYH